MDIKKTIKFSFLLLIGLIIIISIMNIISLNKIETNNRSKNYIFNLIRFQKDMNNLILDSILVKDQPSLDKIEKTFSIKEQAFETLKASFLNDKGSIFSQSIHSQEEISRDLNTLYENEKTIEEAFAKIYTIQSDKLKTNRAFAKEYPKEKQLRNALQKVLWQSNDLSIIIQFANLKYYSKEALYQHKTDKYLSQWLYSAIALKQQTNLKAFDGYITTIKKLSSYTIKLNKIKRKESALIQQTQQILGFNNLLNEKIEKNAGDTLNAFIKTRQLILFIVSAIAILFTLYLALKVYRNVGLSVDVIETKVREKTKEISTLSDEIETTQKEVVFTMGAIGESRSKETGNHVRRVAEYSKLLALYSGLSEQQAEMLKQASPMHDIGKVAIPDAILNKPGRFDEHERIIMNTHAELGYEMLKASNRPLLQTAATVAYQHHEKWDGTGYPQGLKGEDIHIFGRITAVADVFDALGSDRVYKKAWSDEKIFKLFKEERGAQFDPKLMDLFFQHQNEFLAIRDTFKD